MMMSDDKEGHDGEEGGTTMPACKTSVGGSSMKKIHQSRDKAKKVQDITDVTAAVKCLSFSSGVFSWSIIKEYTVGTLAWMDKTMLQKHVDL